MPSMVNDLMDGVADAPSLPDLDVEELWTAIGRRDWECVKELLDEGGYALEDLGALVAEHVAGLGA